MKTNRTELIRFFLTLFLSSLISSILSANERNQKITTDVGIEIDTRLYEPDENVFPGARPTLIFASSWALDKYEYEVQARRFAKAGFLVLSYTPRGFGSSDGVISGAGPNDQRDLSILIDWMESNTKIDVNQIGMAGISYGGGLALINATREPRIKTVVSMSGWADLGEALYSRDTMHKDWVNLLLVSGKVTGRLDPEISQLIAEVKRGEGIEAFQNWAKDRSAFYHLESLNERSVPVYVTSNYDDALFASNQMFKFYERLTGPKKMYFTSGIHFTSEIGGLAGVESDVWDSVYEWFQHYLMEGKGDIKLGVVMKGPSEREAFPTLPAAALRGEMSLEPKSAVSDGAITFDRSVDSGATTRDLPFVSSLAKAHLGVAPMQIIRFLNQGNAAIYQTKAVKSEVKLRGIPKVRFTVDRHEGPFTIVAYLYDTDAMGVGHLLTHNVYSSLSSLDEAKTIDLDLFTLVADIKPGHSLTVVLDGSDPLYLGHGRKDEKDLIRILQNDKSTTQVFLPVKP